VKFFGQSVIPLEEQEASQEVVKDVHGGGQAASGCKKLRLLYSFHWNPMHYLETFILKSFKKEFLFLRKEILF
jgi:hypothetical protein